MSAQVILIADDNEDDVILLKRALKSARIENELRIVSNGEDAICYLKGEGRYCDRNINPFPILLVLNLQMPRKTGGEVLAWMSAQPSLPMLKLIILTGMPNPRQTQQAVHLGAETFLPKPPEPHSLLQVLRGMKGLALVPNETGLILQLADDSSKKVS